MLVQGNQQATASWFTGMLEGEGHFEKRDYNFFRVHLSNTDLDLILVCEEFLAKSSVLFTRQEETRKTKAGKTAYRIYISSQDARNLYVKIRSSLQCRRDQYANIVGASETECDAPLTVDLQWLIGVWQAEGTFYIAKNHKGVLVPYASLENTNSKIIAKVVMTLKDLGCSWYCKDFIPTVKKPYTRVQISGMKRLQRFLNKTQGLWLGRRDNLRTSLMLEFINSRLSKHQGVSYNDREQQIYHLIRDQNR